MALPPVTPHEPVTRLVAGEFDRGAEYKNFRPHGTSDWLLIYTVAGRGRITAADESWDTAPGEAVLYEPHAHQDYATAAPGADGSGRGRWRLRWAHFQPLPHWLPWLHWPRRAPGLRWLRLESGEARVRAAAALAETVRWDRRQVAPGHVDLAVNALERALIWAHAARADGGGWAAMDERVRRAAGWLAEDLRRPFSLARLAAHSGLSVSRLAHLFKAQTGVSPQQFAERRRLERACQLLRHTGLTVAEISEETGFVDAFYFSKRFRRHLGRSPSEFRQAAQG